VSPLEYAAAGVNVSQSAKQQLVNRVRRNVPVLVRELTVWLLWKYERGVPGERPRKVPYYVSGSRRHGKLDATEDRAQLVDFETAGHAFNAHYAGLGIALGKVPGKDITLSGLDFDDCYRGGELDERVTKILLAAQSYSEKSPSGVGLKVFGIGDVGTVKKDANGLEIYSARRFFTVTGDAINQAGLADLTDAAHLARKLFQVNETSTTPADNQKTLQSAGPAVGADPATSEKQGPPQYRNNTLTSLGGSMRRAGFSSAAISVALHKENLERYDPPLPGWEIDNTVKQAEKWERGNPPQPEPSTARLHLLDLTEFATQPSTRWLVRGILPPDSLVVVFGSAKGGKTFSTVDMLMHAAHGMNWCGHRVTRPLRVAFLAGEGRNGLRVRLHAWIEHHDTAQLTGAFKVLPTSISLPNRVEELIELLKPLKPDVVVADTLNAYFGPGDENSTQDMTHFVAACRRLRESLSCSVVVLHHTPVVDTRRERGSGVLRGAADVVIQVAKDESGSGCIGFQVVTGRDIEPMPQPLALRLDRVETDWMDEDGEPLTTCVVRAAGQPVTLPGRGLRPLGQAQATVLACARELAASGTADDDGWVTLARADVATRARASGVAKQSISSAWTPLQTRGYWRLVEPGSLLLRVQS